MSERLEIGPVGPGDVAALARLGKDLLVRAHLGGPLTAADATQRARDLVDREGCYAVRLIGQTDLAAVVTLVPGHHEPAELSYWFDPTVWGRGIAREAVAAVLEQHGAGGDETRVIAVTQASNARSIKLLESLGFEAEHELVEFGERQVFYARIRSGRATAS